MTKVDVSDLLILLGVALATAAYFTKGKLWAVERKAPVFASTLAAAGQAEKTRDIVKKMRESNKNAVVFYGSQTGTAEDYANRLAKEGHAKYGLQTMTADLEDYEYDSLDSFPEDAVAFFVLATYGEGEPTDNAVPFFDFIKDPDSQFASGQSAEETPLTAMKYVAFGLGNKTYEHYNAVVKICDAALSKLGACALAPYGMGDDADGTMEEDFLSWKEEMWTQVSQKMGLEAREVQYEPAFEVTEDDELSRESGSVFLGEPSKKHLTKAAKPFNANNPFLAPIATSTELFTVKGRNCMHVEFDLAGSGVKYKTGDHLALWPSNADQEVERLLRVTGLTSKRHTVIRVRALDSTAKVPVPQPTTYDAAMRYYLEICGPVSRQFLSTLVQFAPDESSKSEMALLSSDKDAFHKKVSVPHFNLAQLLESITSKTWNLPFSVILEAFGKLQPRYYSISSSSLVSPNKVSVTAIVETKSFPGHKNVLNGVTTNYLLALSQLKNNVTDPHPYGVGYDLAGPREKYSGAKIPAHVRQSNFRLPADPSVPILMVGPGTGVAPFRAFVEERAKQAAEGMQVGKTMLFYGCRSRNEDFLYKDTWPQYQQALGDAFDMDVAFSREGSQKVYVQHRLKQRAEEVKRILVEGKGNVYVCGDASHMARDVNNALVEILGDSAVQALRTQTKYFEDVW
ncbi:putative NADPH cytochrome P450 reductase [Protomyces lactucae-debilis]|uniref:NADPH--cytochrome P450 reductase n=1 Tax=Protomyces lactucae-debilis TaxID=2754530 RepID=A0A1Y2F2L6_PROLT|nr:putative NADPH cytochrome P450 reductase [Protomyces lactucae-debilis]ORY78128.1 putative NADPH cytochrome P450 reductase [Protomyces lactucae-debilis]